MRTEEEQAEAEKDFERTGDVLGLAGELFKQMEDRGLMPEAKTGEIVGDIGERMKGERMQVVLRQAVDEASKQRTEVIEDYVGGQGRLAEMFLEIAKKRIEDLLSDKYCRGFQCNLYRETFAICC